LASLKPVRPSQELIAFLHALQLKELPAAAIATARRSLTDTLGCALFGSQQPWSRILVAEFDAEGGSRRASVLGTQVRLPAPAAAMCNGTAAHGFELDDLLGEAVVHPGAIVIPAALAAAEACDSDGERLLLGVVAGYEAMQRIGLAMGKEPLHRGFHKTAIVGPVGAAIAAGIVMRLPFDQLVAAVGLACSTASGIKSFAAGEGGGMMKRMHAGHAASNGVRMAQIAARGFTAPPHAIDGRFGLLEVFGGAGADAALLNSGLGEHWADAGLCMKIYPICGWIQSTVQGLVALRDGPPLDPAKVRTVRVGVSAYAARNNAAVMPPDTMGAQYSIPYCAALALAGEPADPALYAQEALADPARRALAQRVEIFVDPEMDAAYPTHYGARVQLMLADGPMRETAVLDPHGVTADPCTPAEVETKFRRLAASVLPAGAADQVLARIRACEQLPQARALTLAAAV
jgi:2-methylcitrate dehydratase PrpD